MPMQPHDFTQAAANSIAPHRSSERFLHAPPEPAESETIGTKKNREFTARPAARLPIHRIVLGAAQEPEVAREIELRRVRPA